jgi:hypothetical protein
MLSLLTSLLAVKDLARPNSARATQLSSEPNIWITHDFLSSATVNHLLSKVPTDESAYSPCIGQVEEFDSKRCAMVPAAGDTILEAVLANIESHFDVDTSRLIKGGLPIIRYLPGAPPVGNHGDEDKHGVVPNTTLVVYLTPSTGSGQTIFPDADVSVTPRVGSMLSFQNVDNAGSPHKKAKHWVSAVPKDAPRDRLVLQIPFSHERTTNGILRRYAYPEHVSGGKKPGQHESMHGSDAQKAAYQAALAAGMSLAVAYMAAKTGKFEAADEATLEQTAKDTGKFADDDFVKK